MAFIAHIAANPPPEFVYVTRSDDLATVASSTACWLWTLPGRPRVIPTSMETMSIGYVLRALREAGQQSGAGWLDVSEECSGPGAKGKRRLLLFMHDPTIPGEATGDGTCALPDTPAARCACGGRQPARRAAAHLVGRGQAFYWACCTSEQVLRL